MAQMTKTIISVIFLSLINSGCGNDGDSSVDDSDTCVQAATTAYKFDIPDHIPDFVEPLNNLTTEEGVALGKRLYYDVMLSQGGPLEGKACASCHLHANNFSNNADGTSVISHTNLNWSSYFLWNGAKSGSLEEVMDFEVADFFQSNIALFKADPVYQEMNCAAFGSKDISQTDMANALSQWVRTLVSFESKYDRYVAGEVELTEQERQGLMLFTIDDTFAPCSDCHALPLATDNLFHNNGLEEYPENAENLGRFDVTNDIADYGIFKTPSLRNIEKTAPYMHDGRFQTLEDVIEHYDSGVLKSDQLDPGMVTPSGVYSLGLSGLQKAALVAFLKTFTDEAYLSDPKFESPF